MTWVLDDIKTVQIRISDPKSILVGFNPWWETDKVPDELLKPFKRPKFRKYLDYMEDKRILCITGLRRVGKTTLMYQLIQELMREVEPKNILYISFDNVEIRRMQNPVRGVLETYTELQNKDLKKEDFFVFFDEIHYCKDWSFELKNYFDQKYPIKFVISGSSSTNLYKLSSESLVGRISISPLYPFSFREYISYLDKREDLMNYFEGVRKRFLESLNVEELEGEIKKKEVTLLHNKDNLKRRLNEFILKGALPGQFEVDSLIKWQNWLRQDYVTLTLYKDILEFYEIRDPRSMEDLLNLIAKESSQTFSYLSLANNLDLKKDTLKNYLLYLKSAFLVSESEIFSKSTMKRTRRNKKVYLTDIGLRNALLRIKNPVLNESELGKSIETLVHLHIRQMLSDFLGVEDPDLYYWSNTSEVDIVINLNGKILPIEVKYKTEITKRDIAGIEKFMREFKVRQGIIVTKDLLGLERLGENKILFLPLWVFLLI